MTSVSIEAKLEFWASSKWNVRHPSVALALCWRSDLHHNTIERCL